MSQRKGARLPTPQEQERLRDLLDLPSDKTAGVRGAPGDNWDGWEDTGQRIALGRELSAALKDALDENLKAVNWKRAAGTLPMTSLEGPAEAAKKVVDQRFAEWVAVAVRTSAQRKRREAFRFIGSGEAANLIEVSDAKARMTAGKPVSAWDMARYYGATDERCREVMRSHSFASSNTSQGWFYSGMLAAFVAAHEADLQDCDRLGYGMADPDNGRIFITAAIENWDRNAGESVPAVQDFKWGKFKVLVHEYIHSLEHPIVPTATAKSNTFREGVCEYLTRDVLRKLPDRPAGELADLTTLIEGPGAPLRDYAELKNYQAAPDYAKYVGKIDAAVAAMGSEDALLAVFLQGHVEFLGLTPGGTWEEGVKLRPDGARQMYMPSWAKDVPGLAAVTGKTHEQIVADNPDLAQTPQGDWPDQILLPGFHAHSVATVGDVDESGVLESWADIATQHGVTVEALRKANPDVGERPETNWLLVPDQGAGS